MYQRQYLKVEPQTTAHLAQTMSLLSMNNGELNEEIEKILNENPALEKTEQFRCPQCNRPLPQGQICPKCSQPKATGSEDSVVFLSSRSEFMYSGASLSADEYSAEEFTPDEIELPEHILRQIQFDLEVDERRIAAYLITQVDEDGFILEKNASIASYFHIPISKVERIRTLIMHADPIGVGANSPEEAMLVQLEVLNETAPLPAFYPEIIAKHLESLSKKDYKNIAKAVGVSQNEVKGAEQFILNNLNPYPGRASWGINSAERSAHAGVYTNPDIIVQYLNNDSKQALMVEIIIPYGGSLQISALYKEAMKRSESDKKDDLKPDYDKANLFIKCLQQRNNTMRRLLERITKYQNKFIRKGDKFITPLTRATLASELEVHESTISRAVANKSIQLPDGKIVPLAKFFDRSLGVRTELMEIIEKEDKNKPFSDSKIAEILNERGHDLARRTVAKYRLMEGILPAHMRRKQYEAASK